LNVAAKRASRTSTSRRPTKAADDQDRSLKTISGLVTDSDHTQLHRLLNDRVRLGIVSSLAVSDSLSFKELKELLGATDGNLSVHARKLEDGGYIACRKSFAGRKPRTDYTLTSQGRIALKRYLQHMEALIAATDV
jgi:DNA-binding HxlR family transcriptional regulator